MKMLFALSSILGLIILCNSVDGRVEETVELRLLSNPDWSEADVQKMLQIADLESHGFQKEETITLVSSKGSGPAVYRKSLYYYKVVKCSTEELAVMEEINRLMPGSMKQSDLDELRKDVKAVKMLPTGLCQPGIVFHFNTGDKKGSGVVKRDAQALPAILRKSMVCETIN